MQPMRIQDFIQVKPRSDHYVYISFPGALDRRLWRARNSRAGIKSRRFYYPPPMIHNKVRDV
jgi:hypothetical protein